MVEDLATHLHALYLSEQIEGYICSRLAESSIEKGWVERGIVLKGFEGTLQDDTIQEGYVIPTEKSVNLMIDRGVDLPKRTGIILTGSQGLTEEKLAIILDDGTKKPNSKLALTFRLEGYTPQDIGRLVSKYVLGVPLMSEFKEPKVDYIEQLKIDVANDMVTDAIVLSIPRGKINPAKWIRGSLERESDKLVFSTKNAQESPIFALLFSSWVLNFDTVLSSKNGIVSAIFIKEDHFEMILWDNPRNYAVFAIIKDITLEELTHRYLLPLWLKTKERMRPPAKTKEIILESPKSVLSSPSLGSKEKVTHEKEELTQKEIISLQKKVEDLYTRIEEIQAAEINRRLGVIEKNLDKLVADQIAESDTISLSPDISTMIDVFQKRLNNVITKMERLAKRLESVEKKMSSKKLGAF
ncbi:MAG: hypothetical protein BAJATHORv1_10127 [Candidatus Thorarchaeota archaeon]|nr:MAG: hypothetical protein BAJATHORv1_10127 [Candidatus Thorarchaeota archaeon]